MKRIFILLIFCILLIGLTSCFSYYDSSRKDMELIEVKVYDVDGNEIKGTYKNFFHGISQSLTHKISSELVPVNSAAPVLNYYYVDAKENTEYTIKFFFRSVRGYTLTKLIYNNELDNSYINKKECDQIEKSDDLFVATIKVDKVEAENQIYSKIEWYQDDTLHRFGCQGSNTYIEGVYFNLNNTTETTCLNY